MVAVVGAGFPGGCLGGEGGGAADAVDGLFRGERGVQDGQPGAVREQMADEYAFLAGGLELGPVRADRRIEVELSALVQQQRDEGGDALGRGPDHLGRTGLPGRGVRRVRVRVTVLRAAPQVHDLVSVPVDGDRRAPLTAPREVGHEGVPDRLEAVLDRALDVHH